MGEKEEREKRAFDGLMKVVKQSVEGTGNGHKVTEEQIKNYCIERVRAVDERQREKKKNG